MKEVNFKDPYDKVPVVIQIEDDDAEGLGEVIYFVSDNAGIVENLEHKERYHTDYHIEGLVYEGMEYASYEDVESDVARAEIEQTIDAWLRENLTVVQYERFKLLIDGMSTREIAR